MLVTVFDSNVMLIESTFDCTISKSQYMANTQIHVKHITVRNTNITYADTLLYCINRNSLSNTMTSAWLLLSNLTESVFGTFVLHTLIVFHHDRMLYYR